MFAGEIEESRIKRDVTLARGTHGAIQFAIMPRARAVSRKEMINFFPLCFAARRFAVTYGNSKKHNTKSERARFKCLRSSALKLYR